MRPISFFQITISFFLLLSSLCLPAAASNVSINFNDLNIVERDISVYQVSETGVSVIYSGSTENASISLNPDYSYQIVVEPSEFTWIDDPRNALTYFIDTAAGQTISFFGGALVFVGIVKLIFR
ncbi:hypothetical protein ACSAZL_12470 [Methanosarcina sp. T3]|uniref:hypothetical protein n=1 Tax=Methanosarcina sp. T3 TaxID=3439062 RepID=UPI003F83FD43